MKKTFWAAIVLFMQVLSWAGSGEQSRLSDFRGPYLGQKPSGPSAVLFAPDIVTYEAHDSPVFLPDGSGLIIGSMEEGLKVYTSIDGAWTFPGALPFPCPERINGLNISPSGARVYFLIWEAAGGESFWFIEKLAGRWTALQPLGSEVKAFPTHWQFSLSRSGDLYFSSGGTIVVSRLRENQHSRPIPLKLRAGGDLKGTTPFIALDESYLLFAAGQEAASRDLSISFRNGDGTWGDPINLGPRLNAPNALDHCPTVSPDGKYLFFISTRRGGSRLYWAEAGFIDGLRPQRGMPAPRLEKESRPGAVESVAEIFGR